MGESIRKIRPVVIRLDGIDGSGKSSIAHCLYRRLKRRGLSVALVATRGAADGPLVQPQEPVPFVAEKLKALAASLWPGDDAAQHHLLGQHYWLGLASAYFHGLTDAVLPPLTATCDVIVVENWCHKFAAKLSLKGYSPALLEACLPLAETEQTRTYLIDTPPEAAWRRKPSVSFVEMGGQDGYEVPGEESFIHYQGRLRAVLLNRAQQLGWRIVPNTSDWLEDACTCIETSLGLAPEAEARSC